MNSYPIGAVVRCKGTFTQNSTAIDPTTVQFKQRTSAGTITTYTYGTDSQLVKDGTGLYHVDVSVTAGGVWSYRFVGTGNAAAANEAEFFVNSSDFGVNG